MWEKVICPNLILKLTRKQGRYIWKVYRMVRKYQQDYIGDYRIKIRGENEK